MRFEYIAIGITDKQARYVQRLADKNGDTFEETIRKILHMSIDRLVRLYEGIDLREITGVEEE